MNLITALIYSAIIAFALAYLTAWRQKKKGYNFFATFFKAFIGYLGLILLIIEMMQGKSGK